MPIERDELESALSRKGFEKKNTHHTLYFLIAGGKKTSVFTKLSHGSTYREYSDSLVGVVARQMGLTKSELSKFVECTITREGYVDLLRERGRIK
jgi:hypothetical protein